MSNKTEKNYAPYHNINTIEDLLLLRTAFDILPAALDLPKAHYPGEVFLWLDIDSPVEKLFSPEGELLCAADADEGLRGWRLSLTPHGYLRFESGDEKDLLWAESKVPILSFLRDGEPFRVGVSICNFTYALRGTGYEKEESAINRIRLYVAPRLDDALTVCGWSGDFCVPELAAVPRRLRFRDDRTPAFRGRITGVTAYNTQYAEMFERPGLPSADAVIPPVSGGGGFHARWTDAHTIEVYSRPEFNSTGDAWVFLQIADSTGRLRDVSVRTLWSGRNTMNPSFFVSADGDHWERIAPWKIDMRADSPLYTVWLNLNEQQARGCYVSGAIPFLPRHRAAFLEWATSEMGAHVTVPGHSVEGRDIPVARIGPDEAPSGNPHGIYAEPCEANHAILAKKGDPDLFHVVVICGQHSPAETMCAHMLRPMLEEAARLDIMSQCVFHLVPTVNVDCALYGGNGLNAAGRNTNRHWFKEIQPENQAVVNYLCSLRDRKCKVGLGIDLHAGGCWRNHVLFGLHPTDALPLSEAFLARQNEWVDLLERHAGVRRREYGQLPRGHKYAMDRVVELFDCPAFLLELSLGSYFDPDRQVTRVFSQECLDIAGRGIARAIAQTLRHEP